MFQWKQGFYMFQWKQGFTPLTYGVFRSKHNPFLVKGFMCRMVLSNANLYVSVGILTACNV